jgi:acyl dehydratase
MEQAEMAGFALEQGTLEAARELVGYPEEPRFAPHPVNDAMVRHYCALVEDPDPYYWDPATAVPHWGEPVSPPAMLMVWLMPLQWAPESGRLAGSRSLAPRVPLPGTSLINVSTDTRYFRPIRPGSQLNVVERLIEVSDEKRTRLGPGHFVTTLATYRDQRGRRIAETRAVLLRYTPNGKETA